MKRIKISSLMQKKINQTKGCFSPWRKQSARKTIASIKTCLACKIRSSIKRLQVITNHLLSLIKKFSLQRQIHYVVMINQTPKNIPSQFQPTTVGSDHLCIGPSQTEEEIKINHGIKPKHNNICVVLSYDSTLSSQQIAQLAQWTKNKKLWYLPTPTATIHLLLPINVSYAQLEEMKENVPPAWSSITKAIQSKLRRPQFHLSILSTTSGIPLLKKINGKLPSDCLTDTLNPIRQHHSHADLTTQNSPLRTQTESTLIKKQLHQLLLSTNPSEALICSKFFYHLNQYTQRSIGKLYQLAQLANLNKTNYLALSMHYKLNHTSLISYSSNALLELLIDTGHNLSYYKKQQRKDKMKSIYKPLVFLTLCFICYFQHHQLHQIHLIRQKLINNYALLSNYAKSSNKTLGLNQIASLRLLKTPTGLLRLWWNKYDARALFIYNKSLRKLAKHILIPPAQQIYQNKITQLKLQAPTNSDPLLKLAELYSALSFSYQLENPHYIDNPCFTQTMASILWKTQDWNQQSNNSFRPLSFDHVLSLSKWIWSQKIFNATNINPINDRILLMKTGLLNPTWRATPVLHSAQLQRAALNLISIINIPELFFHSLTLRRFIHGTILTSNYKMPPLYQTNFYEKELLHKIKLDTNNPSLFTQAILHQESLKPASRKIIINQVINFYASQYHFQWTHFIRTWRLEVKDHNSNNIHWLIKLSDPKNDFAHAIQYAYKQLTRPFPCHQPYSMQHTKKFLSQLNNLRKPPSSGFSKSHSPPKTFSQLLATYQKNLAQLFMQIQPMLNSENKGKQILRLAKLIIRPGEHSPAFLSTLETIQKISSSLPNKPAQDAMSHLLRLPLQLIWNKINAIASQQINRLWAMSIYQPYLDNLASNYPPNPKATTDSDPDFLQNFMLTEKSDLPLYIQNNIRAFIKTNDLNNWSLVKQHGFFIHLNQSSLSQLQSITNQLKIMTSCSDKHKLCISFEIHPIPNPKLDGLNLHLGNKRFNYHNGPETWQTITLQFPQPTEYANLHVTTLHGRDIITHHQSGQYASLHLLSLAHWVCHHKKYLCTLTWTNRAPNFHHFNASIKLRNMHLPTYYHFIKKGIVLPEKIANISSAS